MKLENLTHDIKASFVTKIKFCFLFALLFITGYADAQTQCPLACNNLVQVSLDDDCRVEITPDMMLEGQGTDPSCTYSVTVMGANGLPIAGSPFVTGSQIDKTLTVKVSLGANSCWGAIKVEDKLAPRIDCPAHLTITCYDNQTFSLPTATDNCGGAVTVKLLSNDLDDNGCGDDYTAVRTLTYQATDAKGNKSPLCIRYVFYLNVDFEDLEFPLNRDDVEAPALECDDLPEWDKNNNGYPDPEDTGAPTIGGFPIFPNVSLCELNATFTDQRINICANSFKVLREWVVLNWCTGEIRKDFQVIKVVDKEAPIITCPVDKTSPYDPNVKVADILFSDPYTCTTSWNVIAPLVIFDCGATTYTVDYLLADANGNPPVNGVYINDNVVKNANGTYTIKNLPVGRTWIRYKVTDACGNFTYCYTEVDVVDNVPPVAVCDEFTVVTLTTGGVAQIFSETFDDGSHDNCTAVTLDSRRMTPGCGASTVNWTNAVNFCCEDVGKDIMVSLRVTDKNGNSNTCMVTVRVQDKIDPTIKCPAPITINCDQDKENLDLTGRPIASDNCFAAPPTKVDNGSLNQCGVGVITRTWSTKDNNVPARTASCTQRITISNNKPFSPNDINWSAVSGVKVLNGCMDIDTDPSKTGKPTWTSDACDLVASTYQDQVFTVVDSACFKILRNWTVIDWCTFDQNNPGAGGLYQFTQVIKLNNTVKPVFDACADITVCAYGEKCDGFVELKKVATDDCTPEEKLVWNYSIDLNNDGTTDKTGKTNDASGTYVVGKHKITWSVEDKCGNKATCTYLFTVKDCKKPTPYCLSEITTVIMPSAGTIDIWATDFDKGSFDNCPGTLKISFSENVNDTKRTFTCNNLGINNLQMWVTDAAGNKEFCTVRINIQSNPGGCGTTSGNLIGGNIGTEQNRMVQNVTVSLASTETLLTKTNENGLYNFQGISTNANYDITAENNTGHTNGLSTLDLVIIQRHILGAQKFNSPYNLIAADINADAKITAADLVELRKVILGIYTTFQNNKSWRFADAAQTFADPSKPWPFNEVIKVNYANTAITNANFKSIKIGDVNESASVNATNTIAEPRSAKTLKLEIGQQAFEKGNKIIVPVYAGNQTEIAGLQFTMKYNNANLKMIGVVPGVLNITDEDVKITENTLATAFAANEVTGINKNDELFAIIFEATNAGTINQSISLTSDVVNSEAYNDQLEIMNLNLSYRNADVAEGVTLMQNVPNPFQTTTTIQFVLPEAQNAVLKVFDITGKTVYAKQGNYVKGTNQIVLNSDQLGAGGVLYYQLETKGYTSTKKMIMMNK